MKKIIYTFLLLATIYSCQNNLIDGGLQSTEPVKMTTLDYLSANHKFDTILMLYKKAGLLDLLNKQNATIIMPTNYSVTQYVKQIKEERRKGDENAKYTFDSLLVNVNLYKDSLKMYIVDHPITKSDLLAVPTGLIETKSLFGNDVELSLVKTTLYSEWLPNSDVRLIYYKNVINGLDPTDNSSVPNKDKDVPNVCQTTGIMTTTGVLHVLEDKHNLFFNKRPRIDWPVVW